MERRCADDPPRCRVAYPTERLEYFLAIFAQIALLAELADHTLMMGYAVAKRTDFVQSLRCGFSADSFGSKRLIKMLVPKRLSVCRPRQSRPEAEHQFCDNSSWSDLAAGAHDASFRNANLFNLLRQKRGNLVPIFSGVCFRHDFVQRIAQRNFETLHDAIESLGHFGVPFVQGNGVSAI